MRFQEVENKDLIKPSVKLIRIHYCDWMLALPNSKLRTDFIYPRVNLNECHCETKINQEVKEWSAECKKTTYIYIYYRSLKGLGVNRVLRGNSEK